jgi:signal transduction histidine kinase
MLTLTDLVLEIAGNSAQYGASDIDISLNETRNDDGKASFSFEVRDNGQGIPPKRIEKFRKGDGDDEGKLGISFLIDTVKLAKGNVSIESEDAESHAVHGTSVRASFDLGQALCPPIGDIPQLFQALFLLHGPHDMVLERTCRDTKRNIHYTIRKSRVLKDFGCLDDEGSKVLFEQYLRSLEEN